MKINVGVSARHVHVTDETIKLLFGKDYKLKIYKELSQKGQFASTAKVTIKTEKGSFENVRILGPVRSYNQIEVSKTDSYKLGLNPPVRESGDISGSESITIVGPNGTVYLNDGCIIASRHIHISPSEANELGLLTQTKVKIRVPGEKGAVLNNVTVKMHESYTYELHLDTDDANANLIRHGDEVFIELE